MRIWFGLAVALVATAANADPVVAPPYDSDYALIELGAVPEVPPSYGGLAFLPGDPDTIVIGGSANTASGKLYRVGVTRGADQRITGFSGPATVYSDGRNNDGGVTFGPGGVLFAALYPTNELAQIRPGSTTFDLVTNLTAFGVASSVGSIGFVPAGLPGGGAMKALSYNAFVWYTLAFAPDGNGTYAITAATPGPTLSGGPEGFVYVPPGSPRFGATPSLLVSEYRAGIVSSYTVDGNGDPLPATRAPFITGLTGAEGAAIDPRTGDFLFSTFGGGNEVVRVQGFAVPPTTTSTSTTTTTTLPPSCAPALVAGDDAADLGCGVDTVRVLADGTPLSCAKKCKCAVTPALDQATAALTDARTTPKKKRCRRAFAQVSQVLATAANQLSKGLKKKCLAPDDRVQRLITQLSGLSTRTKALARGAYCGRPRP